VESENQKAKLAIEEQSKKSTTKYKDVRQDKMKYFNAQRKATKHLPDLNTLSLKSGKKPAKAQHYSSIMQVF
jgi:peptidylprolyl isomerase